MKTLENQIGPLYERLVRQGPYPGGTCPSEQTLVLFVSGLLEGGASARLEAHLAECPPCREDLAALREAGDWFRRNESWILSGLAAKGAWEKVLPWSRCLPSSLLYRYVAGDIPANTGGTILLAQIRQHLFECPDCPRVVRLLEESRGHPRISIAQAGATVKTFLADRLRGFLDSLQVLVEAFGSPSQVRGAPGYRDAELPGVLATLLAPDGKLVVTDEGTPVQHEFRVFQADLKPDGFLTVNLAASRPQELLSGGRRHVAALTLQAGGVAISLPETPLDEDGRVVFTGMLKLGQAVNPLPSTALDLTLRLVQPGVTPGDA